MQRVRIGLTGLAFVFVLVLLAAVFTSQSAEEPIVVNGIEQGMLPGQPAGQDAGEGQAKEPLAELGVAPGNADANSTASAGQVTAPPQR